MKEGERMDKVAMILSEIENGDTDWAATHLDEAYEAGEIDRSTYSRLERALEAAEG
jgi:predicted transcriptional regulator